MTFSDFFNALLNLGKFSQLEQENRDLADANVALELSVKSASTQTALALEQLKHANDVLYNTKKDALEQANKIVDLEDHLELSIQETVRLQNGINSLKTELAQQAFEPASEKPDFLDAGKPAYSAYQNVEGNDVYLAPGEIYDPLKFARSWVAATPEFRTLPKNDKIMRIWDYAIRSASYLADSKVDNWQFPVQTVRRSRGDCEDTTAVFISLCYMAGIKASDVFNAVGPTTFGYHSYPVALLDQDSRFNSDGKTFFIFESTLDSLPDRPMRLNGSKYHVDSLQNWRYQGQVFSDKMSLFNGAIPAAGGDVNKVEDSEEKRQAIRDYWNEQVN